MSSEKSGLKVVLGVEKPLLLDCGIELTNFVQAYQTFGQLNDDRSNVILVCHALSGDQYAGGINPTTGRPGWWNLIIGSGKILDTDKYFIICQNILFLIIFLIFF